uniref:Pentacotripeptide-repeat region of PRORP domain-containing protein n=1 Tax=Arcella intermedia TaxID=1963864 RepID=A0A6B2L1G8_9EUKA
MRRFTFLSLQHKPLQPHYRTLCPPIHSHPRFYSTESESGIKKKAVSPEQREYFKTELKNILKNGNFKKASNFIQNFTLRHEPDLFTYNLILNVYAKKRDLQMVEKVYEELKSKFNPDLFTYNIMIGIRGEKSGIPAAINLFNEMLDHNIIPNIQVYNNLLKLFLKQRHHKEAKKLYQKILTTTKPDPITKTIVAQIYSDMYKNVVSVPDDQFLKDFEEFKGFYNSIKNSDDKVDVKLYNTLLNTFSVFSLPSKDPFPVLECFKDMKQKGLTPDTVTYNILLNMYGILDNADGVKYTLETMMAQKLSPDPVTYCTIVKTYAKQMRYADLEVVIAEMRKKNIPLDIKIYTILIQMYIRLKQPLKLLKTVKACEQEFKLDHHNSNSILLFYASNQMNETFGHYKKMIESGYIPTLAAYNSLVQYAASKNDINEMMKIYGDIKQNLQPSEVTFNPIVPVLLEAGLIGEVISVFSDIEQYGLKPSESVLSAILNCDLNQNWTEEQTEQLKFLKSKLKIFSTNKSNNNIF